MVFQEGLKLLLDLGLGQTTGGGQQDAVLVFQDRPAVTAAHAWSEDQIMIEL